jgi:hypothetical protein
VPRAKLVFALDGAPTGTITNAVVTLRLFEGEFFAPRTFQQYDFGRDTRVEVNGGGKTYLTGGPRSEKGDSLVLDLQTIDSVSTLSRNYEMPGTNGTLDGVLVDANATAPADGGWESVTLHIDF